jgi:hypothetical protein
VQQWLFRTFDERYGGFWPGNNQCFAFLQRSAADYRNLRSKRFRIWNEVTGAAALA